MQIHKVNHETVLDLTFKQLVVWYGYDNSHIAHEINSCI